MKEKLKSLKQYPLLVIFFVFIYGLTAIDLVTPSKSFSDLENRYLQTMPEFTVNSFVKNEYVPKYEKYINDQFVGRNKWIDIKSRAEFYLGKTENNGIVYGKDGYLFDKIQTINTKQLEKNIKSIQKFMETYSDENIKFMLIPSSFEVLKDKVPTGLNLVNQEKIIDDIYSFYSENKNVENINLLETLSPHKDEYIYYMTDHHWTTLGAYYAYEELMKSMGKDYAFLEDLKLNDVKNFYGTYFSKAKKFNQKYDDINYFDPEIESMSIGDKTYDSLYEYEKFDERDKYAAFLYGNNDLTIIKNKSDKKEDEKSRILVIKDSFGNSFVPYLTESYDEIYVLDLRSNSVPVSQIMQQYEFDDILILYSLVNFTNDVNIIRATY